MKGFVNVYLFACLLAGCSWSFPQIDAAVEFTEGFFPSHQHAPEEADTYWLASVNGVGAVLAPYSVGALIVFANDQGDAIAFDGWSIRSVVGFDFAMPISLGDSTNASKGRAIPEGGCEEWILRVMTWMQRCKNVEKSVLLDGHGNIVRISLRRQAHSDEILGLVIDLEAHITGDQYQGRIK